MLNDGRGIAGLLLLAYVCLYLVPGSVLASHRLDGIEQHEIQRTKDFDTIDKELEPLHSR